MNITIYTKSNCPNCVSAKQLLQAKGLEYSACDTETADGFAILESLREKYPHPPDASHLHQQPVRRRLRRFTSSTETGELMICNCHPNSPFRWRERSEPSSFYNDVQFRARKDGKSNGMVQTEAVERARAAGKNPGTIHKLGARSPEKDARLLAYKQFGTNVKNGSSVKKPNKHER